MKVKLLNNNDSRLKEKCTEIDDFTNMEYYKEIIEDMAREGIKQNAWALAAPQFGINKRFILILTTQENREKKGGVEYQITPYFNPVITHMNGLQYFYEGCVSVGDVLGKVARPYKVGFDYQDISGNYNHKEVEGFETIIVIHELDHLNGVEFTDKAEDIQYNMDQNKRIEFRKRHPRMVISKDLEFLQDSIDERYRTPMKQSVKIKKKNE